MIYIAKDIVNVYFKMAAYLLATTRATKCQMESSTSCSLTVSILYSKLSTITKMIPRILLCLASKYLLIKVLSARATLKLVGEHFNIFERGLNVLSLFDNPVTALLKLNDLLLLSE